MSVPAWVNNAIFYQIFPDRFANGDPGNDPANVVPWGSSPDILHFMGGDLEGIRQKLDYLQDLGINAIYLNPIFLSPSSHRYNIVDYFKIDPKLGTLEDYLRLLKDVHRRGMRLILDGVLNHCSRGFFAFNDIMENGKESPYKDWFFVHHYPLNAYSNGPATSYTAWWNFKPMPKFNTGNPQVRKYLLDVSRYWIEMGADGWRLDVPNEIDDDAFWAEFREVVLKANPEAYTVGEIWTADPRWVGDGHFDGLMYYPQRNAILDLLGREDGQADFIHQIENLHQIYPYENVLAMLSLVGSHDTERIKTLVGGRAEKLRLAFFLQFTLPGAPSVYYGDEVGLEGGKDPDCRRAFPWEESQWDHDLQAYTRKLITLRKEMAALRSGDFSFIEFGSPTVLAYLRMTENEKVLLLANACSQPAETKIFLNDLGLLHETNLIDFFDASNKPGTRDGQVVIALPAWGFACFRLP